MPLLTINKPLFGCKILYTRNAFHWRSFQLAAQELGASCIHLALLDTRFKTLSIEDKNCLTQIDTVVFPSQNAVIHFCNQYSLSKNIQIIAIGTKTAEKVREYGLSVSITAPPPYTTEALLSIWQPKQTHIALISAAGGRQKLITTLNTNNSVYVIQAYERFCPTIIWPENFTNHIDILTIFSEQTLQNLCKITPLSAFKLLLCNTTIATISSRVAKAAQSIGFQHCIFAEQATEESLLNAIVAWWQSNPRRLR